MKGLWFFFLTFLGSFESLVIIFATGHPHSWLKLLGASASENRAGLSSFTPVLRFRSYSSVLSFLIISQTSGDYVQFSLIFLGSVSSFHWLWLDLSSIIRDVSYLKNCPLESFVRKWLFSPLQMQGSPTSHPRNIYEIGHFRFSLT